MIGFGILVQVQLELLCAPFIGSWMEFKLCLNLQQSSVKAATNLPEHGLAIVF